MSVWFVAAPVHAVALFVQSGTFDNVRIQMELINVSGDQLAPRIIPGSGSDPVTRGNAALSLGLSAEISAPNAPCGTTRGRHFFAICVGAHQAAQISALSQADTGNEETHWRVSGNRERRTHYK